MQDYEPFFAEAIHPARMRHRLLHAVPDSLLFAKTHWLCNIVAAAHHVACCEGRAQHRRAPSIGRPASGNRGSHWSGRRGSDGAPRTPRRQPRATLRLLEQLHDEFGDAIELALFGCSQQDLDVLTDVPVLRAANRGKLVRGDVAALLQRTDVFVDLSTYQAFGRTALEAMACGCVPVVPTMGGAWEFAQPDVNAIVVDTHDEAGSCAATAALVRDRDRRRRMRDAGFRTAERYSSERAAPSELAIFAGALERARRAEEVDWLARSG